MSKPSEEDKTSRPELHSSDLEEMMRLMAQRGVTGSIAEVFHVLVEDSRKREVGQQTHTSNELTASLNWLTQCINTLERACQELQKERDQLRVAQAASNEVDQLKSENERLKEELRQLQNELNQTRSKLEVDVQQCLGQPNETTPAFTSTQPERIAIKTSPSTVNPPTPTETAIPEKRKLITGFQTQRRRRNRSKRDDRINHCIDALLSWNNDQESSDTRLRISISTVKSLTSAMGASYQSAIQEVMKQREEELKEHHDHLLIGNRHNAGVLQKDEVLQAIARDYLGLPNWEDVKYTG